MKRASLRFAVMASLVAACGNDKGTARATSSSPVSPTSAGASGAAASSPSAAQAPGSSDDGTASAASGATANAAGPAEAAAAQITQTPPSPVGMSASASGDMNGMGGGSNSNGGAAATSDVGPLTPPSGTLRILAVGDSITRATCWRAALWNQLNTNFSGRFDLVGTLTSDNGCSPAGYDEDNQGYSSSLVTEIVAGITDARTCDPTCPTLGDLAQAFATAQPDVLLMHFGTNDVWNAKPIESIVDAYTSVIGAARAANPNLVILAAQLIPMNVTTATCAGCSCANCVADIPALNQRITSWASMNTTAQSPIVVVDQYTGYDPVADSRDGVHPNNDSGSSKMANRWYAALAPLFGP